MVCDWNINKTYDVKTYNCQRFANDVLNAMGIEAVFTGELERFMTQVQSTNEPEKLDFSFKDQKFATHQELDNYVLGMVLLLFPSF